MSRSGYTDDCDETWDHIRWRGAVASAICGRRGQAFLLELYHALDALPEKRLITDVLQDEYDGNAVCALGAVGRARGIAGMADLDPEDPEWICDWATGELDITDALAREIMAVNDQSDTVIAGKWVKLTPEMRYELVRRWVVEHLLPVEA